MATFEQIKEVRLTIDDPEGVIDLQEATSWPGSPAPQTAYKINNVYYIADGEAAELYVSDDRISTWLATNFNYAVYKSIQQILNKIGKELKISKTAAGAESFDYANLTTMRNYYESLLDKYKTDASTYKSGAWGSIETPEIAGGEI